MNEDEATVLDDALEKITAELAEIRSLVSEHAGDRWRLIGYLWADGVPLLEDGTVAAFRTLDDDVAAEFERVGAKHGTVLPNHHNGNNNEPRWRYRIQLDDDVVAKTWHEPELLVRGTRARAFLASVVECEGRRDGLVFDSASAERRWTVVHALELLGLAVEERVNAGGWGSVFTTSNLFFELPLVSARRARP